MVTAGITYVEGDPGWVPPLENWGGVLKRRVVVLAAEENGHRGWNIDDKLPWFPETLPAAIAWLQEILTQVPIEYRDEVEIRVKAEDLGSYEEWHRATLRISYLREPTAEELAKFKAHENASTAAQIGRELRELERLKAKYGA